MQPWERQLATGLAAACPQTDCADMMQPAEAGTCRSCAAGGHRGRFLSLSLGQPEDVTGRGGVGWHIDLGKQRSSHHGGFAQLTIVSECFWEEFTVCLRGRCTGSRKISWRAPPLHKTKETLQIWHMRQHAGGCKSLLLETNCDHRRMRVIEFR